MDHVSHRDLLFVALVCYYAYSRGDDKHLVALVGVPAGGGSFFKIDYAAVEGLACSFWEQILSGAFHLAAGPAWDWCGGVNGYNFNLCDSNTV